MSKLLKLAMVIVSIAVSGAGGAELLVGKAETSITPEDKPIALSGQFHLRISQKIVSLCTANIVAIEGRENNKSTSQAIVVSMDVVSPSIVIQQKLRERVAARLPEFNPEMLFIAATHSHTGPVFSTDWYGEEYGEAMHPIKEYIPFILERLTEAVVTAWQSRQPCQVAWGLGHAAIGQNRRVMFGEKGIAESYSATRKSDLLGFEGWQDHALDLICFTDAEKKLSAAIIAIPCPSQLLEDTFFTDADYWHDVRVELKKRYGEGFVIAGLCGPAGDVDPHVMLRRKAEYRMAELRGITYRQELGRRIANAVTETWDAIQNDLRKEVVFDHRVERFGLPNHLITEEQYESAKKDYAAWCKRDPNDRGVHGHKRWLEGTFKRYEAQQAGTVETKIEMHVIRLGELVLATNPFELYSDFAIRIHGRSPADQTVLVQLASPADIKHGYLPSERALNRAGYSAQPASNPVGPVGGQVLVEQTLKSITSILGK